MKRKEVIEIMEAAHNSQNRADLGGADLKGTDLRDADLSRADLRDANLSGSILSGADLSHADLNGADLSHADLRLVNLNGADLGGANLNGTYLRDANLNNAYLRNANLNGTNLIGVYMKGTDLSGAIGLLDPWSWLIENFHKTEDGFIVYRLNSPYHGTPGHWTIKAGQTLYENPNPIRTEECGCGVNFATRDWCDNNINVSKVDMWECLLPWEGVASLVVPYNTDGRARTGCLKLLRKL